MEYKHFLNQESPHTVIFLETSSDKGEPYYPVPNKANKALYARYQEHATNMTNITFVGRLANYKYFNMDEAILNALQTFDRDTGSSWKPLSDNRVHWCVLSEAMITPTSAKYFDHFPHALESILPCWSWFF